MKGSTGPGYIAKKRLVNRFSSWWPPSWGVWPGIDRPFGCRSAEAGLSLFRPRSAAAGGRATRAPVRCTASTIRQHLWIGRSRLARSPERAPSERRSLSRFVGISWEPASRESLREAVAWWPAHHRTQAGAPDRSYAGRPAVTVPGFPFRVVSPVRRAWSRVPPAAGGAVKWRPAR